MRKIFQVGELATSSTRTPLLAIAMPMPASDLPFGFDDDGFTELVEKERIMLWYANEYGSRYRWQAIGDLPQHSSKQVSYSTVSLAGNDFFGESVGST